MTSVRKHIVVFIFISGILLKADLSFSQNSLKDTVAKTKLLEDVVVTATRTEKSIGDIPVPIQVINKKFIQLTGSQKLVDVLQQQTGLVLADNPLGLALQGYPNPFGSGIQLQGMDPAYTLILLDGEPLTGRNAGVLNLGRIAIGNIERVEIVKGPATSLYGSDALAGVINIITQKATTNTAAVQLHHATNHTWGFGINTGIKTNKTAVQFFVNRYSSSGYDLHKTIYGKTVDPFRNYSVATKLVYDINSRNKFQSSARLFTQKQFNNYLIYSNAQPEGVEGTSNETDWSFNNQLQHIFSKKLKLSSRLYLTGYRDNASVYMQKNNSLYDESFTNQFLVKPELQLEAGEKINQKFITGIGYDFETISANRYASKQQLNTFYLFVQKEWLIKKLLNITAGARIDKHTLYNTQFNPKIALGYKVSKKLSVNASVGSGFKTPDFRQQFLKFTNSLVGYTLLGANELSAGLMELQQQGQIDPSVNITPYLGNHTLLPERSVGTNIGIRYTSQNKTTITANLFRNDINDLIDRYNLPFTKTNNQSIYSYINVGKVYTQGFDINIDQSLNKYFSIHSGYQYLQARDKDIVTKIKQQQLVKRDPVTYESDYVSMKDYGGLFNRSKHTANLQLLYNDQKNNFTASVRANYRGRFGYSDVNGDNILDDDREYVQSFVLLNATVSKTFKNAFEIQAGSENILNHTDKTHLPNLPGRTWFINCNINLQKIF